MKILNIILCSVVFILSPLFCLAETQPLTRLEFDEEEAARQFIATSERHYQDLLSARNDRELQEFVQRWKQEASLINLMTLMYSLAEQIRTLTPVPSYVGEITSSHDLGIIGGRCAWALEQLYPETTFPPITAQSSKDDLATARTLAHGIAEKLFDEYSEMLKPRISAALPVEEAARRQLASALTTKPWVLDALAQDAAVTVRMAVALNPSTPRKALSRLYKDPDPAVSKAARRGRYLAISVPQPSDSELYIEALLAHYAPNPLPWYELQKQPPLQLPDAAVSNEQRARELAFSAYQERMGEELNPYDAPGKTSLLTVGFDIPDFAKAGDTLWEVSITTLQGRDTSGTVQNTFGLAAISWVHPISGAVYPLIGPWEADSSPDALEALQAVLHEDIASQADTDRKQQLFQARQQHFPDLTFGLEAVKTPRQAMLSALAYYVDHLPGEGNTAEQLSLESHPYLLDKPQYPAYVTVGYPIAGFLALPTVIEDTVWEIRIVNDKNAVLAVLWVDAYTGNLYDVAAPWKTSTPQSSNE